MIRDLGTAGELALYEAARAYGNAERRVGRATTGLAGTTGTTAPGDAASGEHATAGANTLQRPASMPVDLLVALVRV